MVTHSLGGGTGSGVGTYMLKLLHDLYPKICRFSVCVFPSGTCVPLTCCYVPLLRMIFGVLVL